MAKAPLIFIGHGSPMHALADNPFTQSLRRAGDLFPQPRAILCVSAHWMTKGSWVTHMGVPRTIHDFYGFPKELFEIQYPAPGAPQMADRVRALVPDPEIMLDDHSWGLDHGTWAVLRHMYPAANIPVFQLSLDMTKDPGYHFELGRHLAALREEGVLILGSGNIVHNLGRLDWEMPQGGYDWAVEFDAWVAAHLQKGDYAPLVTDCFKTEAGRLSIPSLDHYLPLMYVLGAAGGDDQPRSIYDGMEMGSISMRSFVLES